MFNFFFEVTETEQHSPRGKIPAGRLAKHPKPAPYGLFDADGCCRKNCWAADETIEWRAERESIENREGVPHPCPTVVGRDRVGILIFSGV